MILLRETIRMLFSFNLFSVKEQNTEVFFSCRGQLQFGSSDWANASLPSCQWKSSRATASSCLESLSDKPLIDSGVEH